MTPTREAMARAIKAAMRPLHNEDFCADDEMVAAAADAALALVRGAKDEPSPVCTVCWTSSFVPVPAESECAFEHPHEGLHVRCDYCWVQQRAEAAERRAEKLAAEWGLLEIEKQNYEQISRHASTQLGRVAAEHAALQAQLQALQRAHAHQRNLLADLYAWVQTHTNQVMPADLVDPVRAALASPPQEPAP